MAFFCPCITAAQISARLGLYTYSNSVLLIFGMTYFFILLFSGMECRGLNFVATILAIGLWLFVWKLRMRIREIFSIPGSCLEDLLCAYWCTWCSLAQMATHTESYDVGTCSFDAKSTLPGYTSV